MPDPKLKKILLEQYIEVLPVYDPNETMNTTDDPNNKTGSENNETIPDDYSETKDRYVDLTLDFTPWLEKENYIGQLVVDLLYRNRDTYADFRSLSGISGRFPD